MCCDLAYLSKIAHWVRIFTWILLANLILGLVVHLPKIVQVFTDPLSLGLVGIYGNFLVKSRVVTGHLTTILLQASYFLLMLGLSKAIRYLLVLVAEKRQQVSERI